MLLTFEYFFSVCVVLLFCFFDYRASYVAGSTPDSVVGSNEWLPVGGSVLELWKGIL